MSREKPGYLMVARWAWSSSVVMRVGVVFFWTGLTGLDRIFFEWAEAWAKFLPEIYFLKLGLVIQVREILFYFVNSVRKESKN